MKTSSENKFIKDLAKLNGATLIGATMVTTPVLKGGRKNPFKGIEKRTRLTGRIFTNTRSNGYENAVRKLIPDFEVGERAWGTRVEDFPLIQHKDNLYLEMIITRSTSRYYMNGVEVAEGDIEGLKQSENIVAIRAYKFDSIVELRYNKKIYA